jgi:signal transduction histidine kinase
MLFGLTQHPPSIRNSFALMITAVLLLMLAASSLVAYRNYEQHRATLGHNLQVEARRMDRNLQLEFQQVGYLLGSLSQQILQLGSENHAAIEGLLRSFDQKEAMVASLAWVDVHQHAVISSGQGKLNNPIDLSDRDYIKKSLLQPWKVHRGRPVHSRLTNKRVLPFAMTVEDYRGDIFGTLVIAIDSDHLLKMLHEDTQIAELNLALLTRGLVPVGKVTQGVDYIDRYFPMSVLAPYSWLMSPWEEETASAKTAKHAQDHAPQQTHILASDHADFILLLGVNPHAQWPLLLQEIAGKTTPLLSIALLLALMLLLLKRQILAPLQRLQEASEHLLKAEPAPISLQGPYEIRELSSRFRKIADYLQERRFIEHEQRSKTAQMKRAKEQAELSNRVKLDFMSSMSHELRIPLNNIIGFSELMKNEAYGPIGNAQYVSYIEDIYHSSELLQSLINDVLALGKAEAEMMELQEKPLEVQFICTKCIRVLGDRLKEAGITIENRVARDLPKLQVDELRLKQIILNLLINSMSHTPSGGSIVLDAEISLNKRDEPQFDIIITDYGAKRVPMQHQASLRDQMDDEGRPKLRSRNQIGQLSNLGIPLTKALVAMHQAKLEIQSPPGKATRVIVRFPAERIVE